MGGVLCSSRSLDHLKIGLATSLSTRKQGAKIMIESLLKDWDGESLICQYDRPTGAWIFIAIHSTRLGPATGGTRMKTYPDQSAAVQDALRLSAGMTYKFAVPNINRGGGKAVISLPDGLDPARRPDLLRRYGKLVGQLGGLFYTGPDMGTSAADMDIIDETAHPYVFCRTPAAGGPGSPGPFTAFGVFTAIQVACEQLFGEPSPKGKRVLVQGVGSVGRNLVPLLLDADAEVLFSDLDAGSIHRHRDELGLCFIPAAEVYAQPCDIFAPCALGGVLNPETIPQLKCRAVVGGANNQLATPEDATRLQARGILYAPDYVVNVGGAMAIPGIEGQGWSRAEAERRVAESVRYALSRIFGLTAREGITSDAAARQIAEEHLAAAG